MSGISYSVGKELIDLVCLRVNVLEIIEAATEPIFYPIVYIYTEFY